MKLLINNSYFSFKQLSILCNLTFMKFTRVKHPPFHLPQRHSFLHFNPSVLFPSPYTFTICVTGGNHKLSLITTANSQLCAADIRPKIHYLMYVFTMQSIKLVLPPL